MPVTVDSVAVIWSARGGAGAAGSSGRRAVNSPACTRKATTKPMPQRRPQASSGPWPASPGRRAMRALSVGEDIVLGPTRKVECGARGDEGKAGPGNLLARLAGQHLVQP